MDEIDDFWSDVLAKGKSKARGPGPGMTGFGSVTRDSYGLEHTLIGSAAHLVTCVVSPRAPSNQCIGAKNLLPLCNRIRRFQTKCLDSPGGRHFLSRR